MTIPLAVRDHAAALERSMAAHPHIRAVNFHNTPRSRVNEFDRQLQGYSRTFTSVDEHELDDYTATGEWRKPKPGLIVAVYEGYRNGHDVFVPLLERYGFVGWFFIITGFVEAAPQDQEAFATQHRIGMATREYQDGRYAMTWDELRAIDRAHVVASHTRSHTRLAQLDPPTREAEIVATQRTFHTQLSHLVRSFASLSGPAHGEHDDTDRLVAEAGYQFLFSNCKIQRLRDWNRQ